MTTVGSLEDQAKQRKQRLLALKAKKEGTAGLNASDGDHAAELPKPIFRSYKPIDDKLKENTIPDPSPVEVSDKVKDQLASAKPEPILEEVDIAALAPRKPDWDLKRDVAKKLEKLEKRTQRAIAELIRERLKQESNDGQLLARAVGAADEKRDLGADDDDNE